MKQGTKPVLLDGTQRINYITNSEHKTFHAETSGFMSLMIKMKYVFTSRILYIERPIWFFHARGGQKQRKERLTGFSGNGLQGHWQQWGSRRGRMSEPMGYTVLLVQLRGNKEGKMLRKEMGQHIEKAEEWHTPA